MRHPCHHHYRPRTRQFLCRLALVSAVALALRLAVCVQMRHVPSVVSPWSGTDMATYRQLAIDIVAGTWPEQFYYQPLYYAVFLPLVHVLFGFAPWGLMLVQSIVGAVTVGLVGLIGARLFGRRAGLFAAGLLTLARFHVFYTPFALMAVLQAFWIALLVHAALAAYRRPHRLRWAIAAAIMALAILTRGNALLLVPGLLALMAWRHRRRPLQAVTIGALMLALIYAPQLPFALRNARALGRWTGPSSAADAVLALGNTPEAPPGGLEYTPVYEHWMSQANRPGVERIPVAHQILDWIRREPLAFAELKLRALLLFWDQGEIPNNVTYENEGRASALLRAPILLDFSVLGTVGLAGLLLTWRRRAPTRIFLGATIAAYCLSTVVFYILARFRLPVVPLLAVCGGALLSQCVRLWRRHDRNRSIAVDARRLAIVFVLALLLVVQAYPVYRGTVEPLALRLARPHGVAIEFGDTLRVYDHGPQTLGGWMLLAVPPEGMTIEKTFALPERIVPPAGFRRAALRIPFGGRAGTRADVRVGQGSGEPRRVMVATSGGRAMDWLEVPLDPPAPDARRVTLRVHVKPLAGQVFLAMDRQRDYRRTRVLDAGPDDESPGAEAAFELLLQTGPTEDDLHKIDH